MDWCARRSLATATEMLTRIHEADDGSVRQIAFLDGGDVSLVMEGALGVEEILVHAHQLRSNLLFDHTYASLYLSNMLGADYVPMGEEGIEQLRAPGAVEGMSVWPERDSLRIIGDAAVIHLPLMEEHW